MPVFRILVFVSLVFVRAFCLAYVRQKHEINTSIGQW